MNAVMLTTSAQICTFVLGCALIHAAHDQAAAVTRLLVVLSAAVVVLILLSFPHTPTSDDEACADGITLFNAL